MQTVVPPDIWRMDNDNIWLNAETNMMRQVANTQHQSTDINIHHDTEATPTHIHSFLI